MKYTVKSNTFCQRKKKKKNNSTLSKKGEKYQSIQTHKSKTSIINGKMIKKKKSKKITKLARSTKLSTYKS